MHFKYQKILWDIESLLEDMSANFIKTPPPLLFGSHISGTVLREAETIKTCIGNNEFAYQKGKTLFIPPLVFGNLKDIEAGDQIVFTDWEDGVLKESQGLKQYVCGYTENTKTPIYICDNHNAVLEAFAYCQEPYTLIHTDAHKDDAKYVGDIPSPQPLHETKINNYIHYAAQAGFIQKGYISFTERQDLRALSIPPMPNILNIDIDIFAPEVSILTLEEKLQCIFHFLPQSVLITLATSPLFIDQDFAIEIAKLFWKYL